MDTTDNNNIVETTDDHIKKVIQDYLKTDGFKHRKITDTPTDDLQVVNKRYADSLRTASVYGRMYLSGPQSVAASSPTYEKVNFDTSNFSQGLTVDTVTSRFIASTAGFYQVYGAVQYEQPNAAAKVCAVAIYKNSSLVSTTWSQVAVANLNITPTITDIIGLSPNDFVEIYTTKNFSDGLLQSGTGQTYAIISKI